MRGRIVPYRVIWTPDAENDLATVWMAAPDREAVTTAVYQLEQELTSSPLTVGESRRSSVERLVLFAPIGLTFFVVVDDNKVFVTAVTLIS
jgi:hypothetical protein